MGLPEETVRTQRFPIQKKLPVGKQVERTEFYQKLQCPEFSRDLFVIWLFVPVRSYYLLLQPERITLIVFIEQRETWNFFDFNAPISTTGTIKGFLGHSLDGSI